METGTKSEQVKRSLRTLIESGVSSECYSVVQMNGKMMLEFGFYGYLWMSLLKWLVMHQHSGCMISRWMLQAGLSKLCRSEGQGTSRRGCLEKETHYRVVASAIIRT